MTRSLPQHPRELHAVPKDHDLARLIMTNMHRAYGPSYEFDNTCPDDDPAEGPAPFHATTVFNVGVLANIITDAGYRRADI